MTRSPIIVTLDDNQDHFILDGEVTACGRIVPPGTQWAESATNPCPICFPDTKGKRNKADKVPDTEDEAIAAQQEALDKGSKKK